MALIGTLKDNFNDNSIDGAKWSTDGTVVETNQQIELAEGGDLYSATTYDLTASSATCKVVEVAGSYTFWALWLYVDGDNSLYFEITNSELRARHKVEGGEDIVDYDTYNATAMRYLRIREASGTVYWDYSANGSSWTNLASEATPITITAVELNFLAFYGTAKFDDVNMLDVSTTLTETITVTDDITNSDIPNRFEKELTEEVTCSDACTVPHIYYVKNGGDDDSDGQTDATAWETIAKVNASTFSAGDTIRLKCGSTWNEQLIVPSTGTSDFHITFNSYDTGDNPLLDGDSLGQSYGLVYTGIGIQYIDFYNIDVTNAGGDTDGYQIWDDYVRIYNAHASYCEGAGIYFFHNTATGGADYCEAHSCIVDHCCITSSQAFTVEGSNTWLYDCEANDNDMAGYDFLDYSAYTNCTESGAVRCIARRNSQRVGSYDPNFYIDGANNIDLINCLSDDAGYDNENYNAGITINTETEGKAVSDIRIMNCIVYGQKGDALTISGTAADPTDKVYVYNNAFVQGPDGYQVLNVEHIDTSGTGITFTNNIFYATKIASWLTDTEVVKFISDYNTFYTDGNAGTDIFDIYTGATPTGYTLAEWQSGFSQDANSIITDPLFVSSSDFHLQSTSPAINSGTTIVAVTDDYSSARRPQGPAYDMGAYETHAETLSEGITISDGVTPSRGRYKTLSETVNISETTLVFGKDWTKLLLETVTTSDTPTKDFTLRNLLEDITISDTLSNSQTDYLVLTESISITDTLANKVEWIREFLETVTSIDNVVIIGVRFITLLENVTIAEVKTVAVTKELIDSMTGSDDPSADISGRFYVENITVSDSVQEWLKKRDETFTWSAVSTTSGPWTLVPTSTNTWM